MELGDFSSLVEIGIVLCLAVAALDNEKGYVLVIYNALFRIIDYIEEKFDTIKLCDDQTFKSYLEDLNKDDAQKVERHNEEREYIKKEIEQVKKSLIEKVMTICVFPQVRKTNLLTALYGFVCLFTAGINKICCIDYFWFFFVSISLIVLILFWFFLKNTFQLLGTTICLIVILIISIILAFIASNYEWQWLNDSIKNFVWPFSILLIYINVIFVAIFACKKIPQLQKETQKYVNDYQKKCEKFDIQITAVVKSLKGEHFFNVGDGIKIVTSDNNKATQNDMTPKS